MDYRANLLEKIENKKAKIGLVGIGYVGSALGFAAAEAGFEVIGYARSNKKIDKINALKNPKFIASNDFSKLSECDIICICVPTPIFEDKQPDLGPLENSLVNVAKILSPGQLITIESSIAPGTTRNFALPILLESDLKPEEDFFLAFSPERVDPGNTNFKFKNIPKVVAGYGNYSSELVYKFYSYVINKAVLVSSLEAAEMTKIFENTFRLVNISLVNELSEYTNLLGIDIYEVIHAASTKPFGFLAHYPGPGIGGHCIPVDPYYLVDDAKKRGISLKIVEQAGVVNDEQPVKVKNKALNILEELKNGKEAGKVLLVGVTYKPDVSDTRESSALRIWELLEHEGYEVFYHDPYVPSINGSFSQELSMKNINGYDLIIIVTHHKNINYEVLINSAKPILDTRNVIKDIKYSGNYLNIYKL